ncbi:MAG: hypothetical protein ABIQ12_12495 [Opitutaceae bacterium]
MRRNGDWQTRFQAVEAATDAGNATTKNHGQKFTLRLLAKLAEKESVTLLCHCAEDAKECHRFEQ